MKKFFCLLILISFLTSNLQSQTFSALVKAGTKKIEEGDLYAAMVHLSNALEIKPENPEAQYQYAEVARHFLAFEIASKYYQKVLRGPDSDKYPVTLFWLGDVSRSLGEYDLAMAYFQQYLEKIQPVGTQKLLAESRIRNCQWAKELQQELDSVEITHLDKKVNTPYSEFGPLQRGDTLYYSSFRFEVEGEKEQPPKKITKVLTSLRGAKGRPMRRNFNSKVEHTAHNAFSLDGKRFYFTRCQYVNSTKIQCALYYREKDRRNRWQTKAVKLPKEINVEGATVTQPSIGFDSTLNAEVLYYASDRRGGKGKMDIWWVKVLQGDNEYSAPRNFEEVNTEENEATPYFHTLSQTLFFSSEGHENMGGYDLFRIQRNDLEWRPVRHLGAPLNTSYNEVYFALNPDGKTGYFASNRPGSFYLDVANKACCNDIFQFELLEPFPEEVDTVEVEQDPPQLPPPIDEKELTPLVFEPTLEDFFPLSLYFDNDEPDKRTIRKTTRKTYGDSFEKYYDRKSIYKRAYTAPMSAEDKAFGEMTIETFFEDDVRDNYDSLQLFSNLLIERLNKGDTVEIFVQGFTSPLAKSDYNLYLSSRRINSLVNHFQKFDNGVFLPFLESEQLKITEQPLGEQAASKDVSDDYADQRNSIYNVGAAKERRVEITEIKRTVKEGQ